MRPATETYTIGDGDWARAWMRERSVETHARFLLPHLRPGQRLLDCGCGPGTITADLAAIVSTGETWGIDISAAQIAAAASRSGRHPGNLRFGVADVYELPFESGSFDVVYAQSLLMHLKSPERALAEMRRVLCAGGVLAVRDPDYGALLVSPEVAEVEALLSLFIKVVEENGGSPFYARHLRRLLREAGFQDVVASADALSYGASDTTASVAHVFGCICSEPGFRDTARRLGVTDDEIDRWHSAMDAWSRRADAFYCMVFCETVGWVS